MRASRPRPRRRPIGRDLRRGGGGEDRPRPRGLAHRRGSAQTLWAQCDPLHTPRALGPVLDLARAAGGDLATLADTDDRHGLFAELIASWSTADSTVIAVIDDLQWADAATLDFVAFAGRRLDLTHCVLIVTLRDEITHDHPVRAVLGDLATAQAPGDSDLRPSARAGSPSSRRSEWDARELHRLSAGVPFVVTELLTSEPGALTSVHESVLAGRLDWTPKHPRCSTPPHPLRWCSRLGPSPGAGRQRARDRRVRGGWASRSRRPHPEFSTRAGAASR